MPSGLVQRNALAVKPTLRGALTFLRYGRLPALPSPRKSDPDQLTSGSRYFSMARTMLRPGRALTDFHRGLGAVAAPVVQFELAVGVKCRRCGRELPPTKFLVSTTLSNLRGIRLPHHAAESAANDQHAH